MQLISKVFDLIQFLPIQATSLKDQNLKRKDNKKQPNKNTPTCQLTTCTLAFVILKDITHWQKLDGLSPLTAVIPRLI